MLDVMPLQFMSACKHPVVGGELIGDDVHSRDLLNVVKLVDVCHPVHLLQDAVFHILGLH